MFRRLQNQKSLFQSRVWLNESDLGSEDTDVLVPEYEIHQPYQFNLMRNLTAGEIVDQVVYLKNSEHVPVALFQLMNWRNTHRNLLRDDQN